MFGWSLSVLSSHPFKVLSFKQSSSAMPCGSILDLLKPMTYKPTACLIHSPIQPWFRFNRWDLWNPFFLAGSCYNICKRLLRCKQYNATLRQLRSSSENQGWVLVRTLLINLNFSARKITAALRFKPSTLSMSENANEIWRSNF